MLQIELEAMSRRLKSVLLFLALAGIGALIVLCIGRQRVHPLVISYVGTTNVPWNDRPLALFLATNSNSRTLRYSTHIERKTAHGWPVYPSGPLPHTGSYEVFAGQELKVLQPPPSGDEPWRLSVLYWLDDGPWGQRRWRVAEFFYDRNLPAIGKLFHEGAKGYFALSPEVRR